MACIINPSNGKTVLTDVNIGDSLKFEYVGENGKLVKRDDFLAAYDSRNGARLETCEGDLTGYLQIAEFVIECEECISEDDEVHAMFCDGNYVIDGMRYIDAKGRDWGQAIDLHVSCKVTYL